GAGVAVVGLVHEALRCGQVVVGEPGLPLGAGGVHVGLVAGVVAPGKLAPIGATRRELPLGLGGQALVEVLAVGLGAVPIDAVDGVVAATRLLPVAELGVGLQALLVVVVGLALALRVARGRVGGLAAALVDAARVVVDG